MIIDAIIGFILALPNALINSLSSVGNIVIPTGAFDWWKNTIYMLTYVFPVYSILPIMFISMSIKGFQIAWALLNKLKGFIPTLSD